MRQANLRRRQKELLDANSDVVRGAQAIRLKEEEEGGNPLVYIAIAFTIVLVTGIVAVYGLLWVVDNVEFVKRLL
jgi:hypothetical protein